LAEKDLKVKNENTDVEEKELSPEELIGEFFDEIPEKEPIVVGIAGPQGHGKTHFINTFPNPVIGDTEGRSHIVMKKFKGQRYRKITNDMMTIRQTLSMMNKNLCPEVSQRNKWTYALDSSSDFQGMAEQEYLKEAKKDKVYPLVLWAKVYEKMDTVFDKIREWGYNAVFTQQIKEIYRDEKATGEFMPAGYKKLQYRVDIWLQFRKGVEHNGELYYPEIVVAEVLKDCWHKPEETKPYLVDVSYDGIFKELKGYKHPSPGNKEGAMPEILKELEKKTGIPINKAKAENKEA
jgi:hypothetical protein